MSDVVALQERCKFFVKPKPPFNFVGTVHKPSHFPTPIVAYGKNQVVYTMTSRGKILGVRLTNDGDIDEPLVFIKLYSNQEISEDELIFLKREIGWRCGFDEDISNFCAKFESDKILGPVLQKWRGMRISCKYSLYELSVVTIVLQNSNVQRTTAMLGNLFHKYGSRINVNNRELFAFWVPEAIADEQEEGLRHLRIGYRAKFLKGISQSFKNNEVDEEQIRGSDKEQSKKILLRLKGIGPASAQILLIESLRHYDALEIIPPWEQKIYSRLLFSRELVPVEAILGEITGRWGKWKALAMHYLLEDLFWRMKEERIEWLERLIRA